MHLDSATAGFACRRTICASNQLREITAWAFRSSGDAEAFISDAITLTRYSSTPIRLTAVTRPSSAISSNAPRNTWSSVRCQ